MTFAKWWYENVAGIEQDILVKDFTAIKKSFEAAWHDGYKVGYSRPDAPQPVIEADAIFDPVCRKCGDPLTTEELICDACRTACGCEVTGFTVHHKPGCPHFE